jgi:hypothetical protein
MVAGSRCSISPTHGPRAAEPRQTLKAEEVLEKRRKISEPEGSKKIWIAS